MGKQTEHVFFLLGVIMCVACISAVKIGGYGRGMPVEEALAYITTHNGWDPMLVRSIAVLRRDAKEKLTKELLIGVCTDKTFSPLHRRRCVLQLLALYASDGMRLDDF